MKPDEIKQLLGGYATGTLTPDEQKALFDAALQDQELFDALAREQPLKEVLDHRTTRAELIEVLSPKPSWRDWLRWRYPIAAAGALAAAAVTIVVLVRIDQHRPAQQAMRSAEIADARRPETAVPPPEPAAPAPQPRAGQPSTSKKRQVETFNAPVQKAAEAKVADHIADQILPTPAAVATGEAPANPLRTVAPAIPPPAAAPAAPVTAEAEARFVPLEKRQMTPRRVTGGVVGGVPSGLGAGAVMARAPLTPRATYTVKPLAGGAYQLVVRSPAPGILYLFRRTEKGDWETLIPGGLSTRSNAETTTPSFVLNKNASPPQILAVISRTALTSLAQGGNALTSAVNQLRAEPSSDGLSVIPIIIP